MKFFSHILILFCTFAMSHNSIYNVQSNYVRKNHTEATGRKFLDRSERCFELCDSDLRFYFTQILFSMSHKKGQNYGKGLSFLTQFEKEKNIKNHLYYFILSSGLLNELREYEANTDMSSPTGHAKVMQWFSINSSLNLN